MKSEEYIKVFIAGFLAFWSVQKLEVLLYNMYAGICLFFDLNVVFAYYLRVIMSIFKVFVAVLVLYNINKPESGKLGVVFPDFSNKRAVLIIGYIALSLMILNPILRYLVVDNFEEVLSSELGCFSMRKLEWLSILESARTMFELLFVVIILGGLFRISYKKPRLSQSYSE